MYIILLRCSDAELYIRYEIVYTLLRKSIFRDIFAIAKLSYIHLSYRMLCELGIYNYCALRHIIIGVYTTRAKLYIQLECSN